MPDAVATAPVPPFEGGDALFENGGRGVVQAGVDVPRFREGENGGALFRTFEGVGHRLVDGDGARSGRGIGLLACMYLQGFETEILFFMVLKVDLCFRDCYKQKNPAEPAGFKRYTYDESYTRHLHLRIDIIIPIIETESPTISE